MDSREGILRAFSWRQFVGEDLNQEIDHRNKLGWREREDFFTRFEIGWFDSRPLVWGEFDRELIDQLFGVDELLFEVLG